MTDSPFIEAVLILRSVIFLSEIHVRLDPIGRGLHPEADARDTDAERR
jgi:hypothetical protein